MSEFGMELPPRESGYGRVIIELVRRAYFRDRYIVGRNLQGQWETGPAGAVPTQALMGDKIGGVGANQRKNDFAKALEERCGDDEWVEKRAYKWTDEHGSAKTTFFYRLLLFDLPEEVRDGLLGYAGVGHDAARGAA